MKQLKVIGKIISVFFIIIALNSCFEDEYSSSDFDFIGDVYFKKRMIDDTTQYALSYYVYGSEEMSSAFVTTPENDEIELAAYDGSGYTFYDEPSTVEYSTEAPATGDYTFTVTYNGTELSGTDVLEFYDLEIPDTIYFEYNSISQSIDLEWNTVYGADGYIIQMKYTTGEMVYSSDWIDDETNYASIDIDTGTWYESPASGTTYIVEILAIRFETSTYYTSDAYNINEMAIKEIETTWGEE